MLYIRPTNGGDRQGGGFVRTPRAVEISASHAGVFHLGCKLDARKFAPTKCRGFVRGLWAELPSTAQLKQEDR
jgi:hypothetical protein